MSLQPNQKVAHYRLEEQIGEGGMGVVWRATDTKLNRDVAIKVLPEEFSQDPERLSRFQREARLLASLNHANIASIHGLEEEAGVRFLVMEMVQGEGLDKRLQREPMSVERSLSIALQISEALESAHENGVIHRDLKPANIMLSAAGPVKVLDFGLAKAIAPGSASTSDISLSHSPTMTSGGTHQGMIMGTAPYMSPEQARGRVLDKRSDIWSFGCILFECLTARRMFAGETVSDSLAAILRAEPDLSDLPAATPRRVRELLERCLVKDPRNRLRDMGDARLELEQAIASREWLSPGTTGDMDTKAASRTRSRLLAPALFLAGALAGIALWAGLAPTWDSSAGPAPALRLAIPVAEGVIPSTPRITPDGQTIVYVGREETGHDGRPATSRLYTRALTEDEAQPVQGTEGISLFDLSPDGRRIAFVAPTSRQSTRLQVSHVPLDRSAPPLAIRDWSSEWTGLLWVPGDLIATVSDAPPALLRIPVDGRQPEAPLPLEMERTIGMPALIAYLPGSQAILCNVNTWGERGYQDNLHLLDASTGMVKSLVEDAEFAAPLPDGRLLVSRHDTLLAIPFDIKNLKIAGGPVPVMGGLRVENTWNGAWFDLADNGTLVHLPGGLIGLERRLSFLQDGTKVVPWSEERRAFDETILVSRDGTHFAVIVANAQQLYEIWVSNLPSPRLTRLVAEPGADCYPRAWTAAAGSLVYDCTGNPDSMGIWIRPVDGSSPAEMLMVDKNKAAFQALTAQSLSPDERVLLVRRREEGRSEILALPLQADKDGQRTPVLLPELTGTESVRFSPDGRWVAYISDASGRKETYVRRYHAGGSLGPGIPVSTQGATEVRWAKAKQAQSVDLLLTRPGIGKAFAVTMRTEPTLSFSAPREVFDPGLIKPGFEVAADLPDGRWFGIEKGPNEDDSNRVSIVFNWLQDMERRFPSQP